MKAYTKRPGRETPVVTQEIPLPEHHIGLYVEIGGEMFRLTEREGRLVVTSETGRLVIHCRVSNSVEMESA